MLKIRIAGTESELRQVAHKVGATRFKRLKQSKGKANFAIDLQISVKDFLDNMNLSGDKVASDLNDSTKISNSENCNPEEIQAELEALLNDISDEKVDK